MNQVCALVDYDNCRQGTFRSGRAGASQLSYRDHEDFIHALVEALLSFRADERHRLVKQFAELRIRLYGGWMDPAGSMTEMGDMVAKALRSLGGRKRSRDTRLFVELADRLLVDRSDQLVGTWRVLPWLGAGVRRNSMAQHCAQGVPCSHVEALLSWTKGRCPNRPGCSTRTREVFQVEGQKLVDTFITSDAFLAHSGGYHEILAVSMDDDLVPGVLALGHMGAPITLLRFGRVRTGLYDGLVQARGIPLIDYPSLG
jgi:hypothetical protein